MAEQRADRARQLRLGAKARHEHDRQRPLQGIAQQGRSRQALPARAQHIGGSDIARADRAQVLRAGQLRQD
jgi:hypothetical protein